MKRWNGWGEQTTSYPLPDSRGHYLEEIIGPGLRLEDISFEQALTAVPPSRLSNHPLISTDSEERLRHARGQSLPDWIAMRSGRIGIFPDGIAHPTTDSEVRTLLELARKTGIKLIPYGGGTSVAGHITPTQVEKPNLTVDMTRMNRLLAFDEKSHLATFEAGASGPEIEKQLGLQGCTLGHFPQSFEFSTLGGWIVTRSTGQQSFHYGRIENLFAGGHIETPIGAIDLPVHPASAAGPDLKQLFLGSEGRLGIVTRATVRVRNLPANQQFLGYFFHNWQQGVEAVRQIVQAGIPVSMLRMSNAVETAMTISLAGKESLIQMANRGLRLLRYGDGRSLLVMGITDESGNRSLSWKVKGEAERIICVNGGLAIGTFVGKMWEKSRFYFPYLRNTLWELGYALDTLETAVPWANFAGTAEETLAVIRNGLADIGERLLVFAHLSHVYNDGASIYITYLFRRSPDPEETLRRWQVLKGLASRTILAHGGTISHQHGVGLDHSAYLAAEKGPLGMLALENACRLFDPNGSMNPGKLLER